MLPTPFLTLNVVNKRDVLVLRQRARQVAGLLHLTGFDRTYVAAAAFAIGSQARQLGLRKVCFAIEHEQLHIFALADKAGTAIARNLLRLVKPLPKMQGLDASDIGWLIGSLPTLARGGLHEEVAQQNEEVLGLVHELQKGHLLPSGDIASTPSAA